LHGPILEIKDKKDVMEIKTNNIINEKLNMDPLKEKIESLSLTAKKMLDHMYLF
jgi:hypothetical protein